MSSALIESELDGPPSSDAAPLAADVDVPVTVVEPDNAWSLIDFRELYQFRDLFRFLVWRNVKVLYAQSALGIGWAIVPPLFQTIVFTVVFGRWAKVDSGVDNYSLFAAVALVPWMYFANSLSDSTNSLVSNANMLSKVYFPRMILPLSAVTSKLVDFAIAMLALAIVLVAYREPPNWGLLVIPYLILLMMISAAGLGMWLTALAIQYRDVKHAMTFMLELLKFAAPVIYPASAVPEKFQYLYALNPMVGVIEGFRTALLKGYRDHMPWDFIAIGTVSALVIAISGAMYFRRKEQVFADVA